MKELPKVDADEVNGGGLGFDQSEVILPLPAPDYPQCPASPVASEPKRELL